MGPLGSGMHPLAVDADEVGQGDDEPDGQQHAEDGTVCYIEFSILI